jgi:peptidoglycan hydrolase-like protein with peptidoglycan-binding domain
MTPPAPPAPRPTTAAPEPPPEPPRAPPLPPRTNETLRPGDSGPAVLALQQRLTDLGYWLGSPDGDFGALTTQAVLALQGTAGIARDGKVGPQTREEMEAGTRPAARSSSGTVTEIDLDHGVILFVRDGTVRRVLHTSTGTFKKYTHEGRTMLADTPRGRWTVTWAQNGWRDGELGRLYRPRYFHRDGVAVHGYPSVPAYPASHGCARVTMAAMDMIWSQNLMPKGTAVWVY